MLRLKNLSQWIILVPLVSGYSYTFDVEVISDYATHALGGHCYSGYFGIEKT